MKDDREIKLSESLVNAVGLYLGKQPYDQVYQLIDAIKKDIHERNPELLSPAKPSPAEATSKEKAKPCQ